MVEARLLGSAQDAGLPHIGCDCANCRAARRDPSLQRHASCLALIADGRGWLIDATPQIATQVQRLSEALQRPARKALAGILLTHAHMGHLAGLWQLGREAWACHALPIFATESLARFLQRNEPWASLIREGHLALTIWRAGQPLALADGLHVTPIAVPHRAEWSDTVAVAVEGPRKRLFYCPDIDVWEPAGAPWFAPAPSLRAFFDRFEVALIDATFFSASELPGRDLSQIPHPLVTDSVARLEGTTAALTLIHLNHSNPLLRDGPERAWAVARSLQIGQEGARWAL
ncbi:MAG: MBL fold metallo-hydrolase [Anaerolineales bacterium]|nr:MBL fold metallo-hydrolase [Anaerolineales bacterium]MCB9127395.1 MBL fold metallo-hydrolase [Ardenticatenales bacterium]